MNLILRRKVLTSKSTIGELREEDGTLIAFTLEDRQREDGEKVPGETAIPCGTYEIVITHSQRFNRPLPLLLNVPNFSGIRIHPGNTAADTHGCILVGTTKQADKILNSRVAFDSVFHIIEDALNKGKVFVAVTDVWKERDVIPAHAGEKESA